MQNNPISNILGLELGQVVLDGINPSNCIIVQTKRSRYFFRLSESFPVEQQIEIFKRFVSDIHTPVEEEQPKQESNNESESRPNEVKEDIKEVKAEKVEESNEEPKGVTVEGSASYPFA